MQRRRVSRSGWRTLLDGGLASYSTKAPLALMALKFGLLLLLFYSVTSTETYKNFVSFDAYASAQWLGFFLDSFGEHCRVESGSVYTNGRAIITILPGCTAVDLACMLCAGIIAFPSSLLQKMAGMMAGCGILMAVNILRYISLYFVGTRWPEFIDTLHETIWPPIFNVVMIGILLIWAGWADRIANSKKRDAHALI